MNLMLGIGEPEYSIADESAEAVEYWAGKTDGKSGDCLEPLFFTYSCDPLDWSSNDRNATLFTCEEENDVPTICIDSALVCTGKYECPNGADEVGGGMDCEEHECAYPELEAGVRCDISSPDSGYFKGCVMGYWTCNGHADCRDGEDENDCED